MSRTNLYECVQHSSGTAKVGVWVIVTVRVRHCTVVKYPHSTWPYIFLGLPMFLKSPVLLYCARCQIRRTFIYFFKIELGLCGGPLPLCTAGLWARVAPCRGGAGNLKIFLRLVLRGNYHQDVLCVNVKHTATCKDTSQLVHACVCWRGHCGRPAGHIICILSYMSIFLYLHLCCPPSYCPAICTENTSDQIWICVGILSTHKNLCRWWHGGPGWLN